MAEELIRDVCIIGAGPGGLTCAMFLAQMGISSTVVDKAVFPRDKVCGDALSGKVVEVIKKLDPEIITRLDAHPEQVGSWGVNFVAPNQKVLRVPFKRDYDTSDLAPGFISKRLDFDNFLLEEAIKHPQIEMIQGETFSDFERIADGYQCISKKGTVIKAKLVIAADGAQSQFAKKIGKMTVDPGSYCGGVRAYYKGVEGLDRDNFIELHFLKELLPGYFWIFPLPNGGANVGLGIRSDVISKKKLNLKELLEDTVSNHPAIRDRFKHATLEGKVAGFGLPLGSKKRKISGDHFMLIGDAASLIDPFTGEGIGNAMMSGMFAAQQAERCLGQSDFSAGFVKQYDTAVYNRLWSELKLSRRMQQMVQSPWLFNLVVNKAINNKTLQETISCMFEDLDVRNRLKQPSFYVNLLFN